MTEKHKLLFKKFPEVLRKIDNALASCNNHQGAEGMCDIWTKSGAHSPTHCLRLDTNVTPRRKRKQNQNKRNILFFSITNVAAYTVYIRNM